MKRICNFAAIPAVFVNVVFLWLVYRYVGENKYPLLFTIVFLLLNVWLEKYLKPRISIMPLIVVPAILLVYTVFATFGWYTIIVPFAVVMVIFTLLAINFSMEKRKETKEREEDLAAMARLETS